MGISLGVQYRIIALVCDNSSEISLQYILLFYCLLYNNLAYLKKLTRIGLVGLASIALGLQL